MEKEDRRLEAIEINKSLSALGDVIEAGSSEEPFADSICHTCHMSHRQLPKRRSTYRTGVPRAKPETWTNQGKNFSF